MMNILPEILTYGISNMWTAILLIWLMNSLFTPVSSSRLMLILLAIGTTILTTIINVTSSKVIINMALYLTVVILCSLFFKPVFQAMFLGYYFFFTHLLIEDIVVITGSLMGYITYNNSEDIGAFKLISLMAIVEIVFVLCLLFVKPKVEIIQENKKYFSYWSVSFALVSISLFILHFTTINSIPNEQISLMQVISAIVLFCIMHFLLICLSSIIKFDIMKAENRQLQATSRYYAGKLQESIDAQNNDRLLRHDLKKVFYAIQIMADKNDIKNIKDTAIEYSEKLSACQNYKANTGIADIDDIINHLLGLLDDDVQCNFSSIINEPLRISSRDCIVLLGNLLENAIEAVKQVVTSKKILNIKVTIDRNIFHVEVINSYNGTLNYDDSGNLLTSKDDKYEHGYGLKSVSSIVKKHNGISEFVPIDSILFSSSIILFQDSTVLNK